MPSFSFEELYHHVVLSIVYELGKYGILSLIGIGAVHIVLKYVFKKVKTKKEVIALWGGLFILCSAIGLTADTRPQAPILGGGIQSAITGNVPGKHDTIAVMTMGVINTGTMQTIVKNWQVSTDINGVSSAGLIIPKPQDMKFDTSGHGPEDPLSITHRALDNILEKTLTPIQPGALLAGDLFVLFRDIDADIFKAGALITVTYEDVFSKKYVSAINIGGKFTPTAPLIGLHTELACPVPKDFFQQNPIVTSGANLP